MATAGNSRPGNHRKRRPEPPAPAPESLSAHHPRPTRSRLAWPVLAAGVAIVLAALVAAFLLGQGSAERPQAVAAPSGDLDPAEAERLEAFLDRYFTSWSEQDMEAYRDCFHPRATIHHIDAAGRVTMQRLDDFIAGQRAGHARSPVRMIEVPLWHRVEPGLQALQVHVRWHLAAGEREVLGRNHYTLQRGGEHGFQIINLVFYGEEATEAES